MTDYEFWIHPAVAWDWGAKEVVFADDMSEEQVNQALADGKCVVTYQDSCDIDDEWMDSVETK